MSGGQKLSAQRLQRTETRIDEVISSMNGQVKDLEAVIEMLATQWRGVGAGQFTKAQRDINMYHSNLQKLMAQVREAVASTRKSGGTNDDAVAASMKSIEGMDFNGSAAGNGVVGAGGYADTGGNYTQYSKLNGL